MPNWQIHFLFLLVLFLLANKRMKENDSHLPEKASHTSTKKNLKTILIIYGWWKLISCREVQEVLGIVNDAMIS